MLLGDVGILISVYNINLNPPKNNKLCTFCLLGCFHKKGSFCRICICSASFGKCLPRSFLKNTTPNYLITGTFQLHRMLIKISHSWDVPASQI